MRECSRDQIDSNHIWRILLENYYLPGDLEARIAAFVADYNHLRHYESIGNLTPANVYFGRDQIFLIERERIKRQTIANRRLLHRRKAAYHYKPDEPETLLFYAATCPKNFDDGQPSVWGLSRTWGYEELQ